MLRSNSKSLGESCSYLTYDPVMTLRCSFAQIADKKLTQRGN